MKRPIAVAAAAALGAALALAVPQGGAVAATPASRVTASASQQITATGTVEPGTHAGCLILLVPVPGLPIWDLLVITYLLIGGDPAVLVPGARVRVTGVVDNSIVSPCAQGHPLVVSSATPA